MSQVLRFMTNQMCGCEYAQRQCAVSCVETCVLFCAMPFMLFALGKSPHDYCICNVLKAVVTSVKCVKAVELKPIEWRMRSMGSDA